jgi:hypothetical protein
MQCLSAITPRPFHIVVLAFAGGVVALTCSMLPRNVGMDFWNCSEAEQSLDDELKRSDLLDDELEIAMRRNAVRMEVLEDLAAGRISLVNAVQRSKEFNDQLQLPELMPYLRGLYPGSSDEECIAIQLIRYMEFKSQKNGGKEAALVQRLEKELNAMKASSVPETR